MPRWAVPTAVGLAGLAVGAVSLAIARGEPGFSFGGTSVAAGIALVGTGWALIGAGLGARIRRRESRFGLLLVCVGFAWFLVDWATPGVDSSVLFTIGLALGSSCPPFVAHAALSSTGARITAWWERAALATAYAGAVLVLGVLPALFFDPVAEGCSTCPENRLLVTTDPAATDRLLSVGVHLGLAWALVLVGVLAWRLVRATSAARRITAPLITAASVYLALVAATFATSLDSGFVTNDELSQRLWLGEAVALGLLSGLVAWGWLRGRRTRSTVAQLVVELAQSPAPGGLRDVLADTLDDPGLVLAYPVADGRFVDASGRPVDLDEAERERTPIVSDGGTVSVLSHRPGLLDDPEVVRQIVAAARLTLENERLQAESRAQIDDLRASRARIVEVGDAERRRLERDLHDGAQQRLVALLLSFQLLRPRLGEEARKRLDGAAAELRCAVDDLRTLAHGIFPAVLADEGLAGAVEALAEDAAIPITVEELPVGRFPPAVESAAYSVVADVTRAASGPVTVRGNASDGLLVVEVDTRGETGDLVELEDRVGAVDGRLAVDRTPDGHVTIRVEIPCAS